MHWEKTSGKAEAVKLHSSGCPLLGDNGALHDNQHIKSFFADLRDTHASGVGLKETSYYPYLSNLFNVIGKKLKPRVRCIIFDPHLDKNDVAIKAKTRAWKAVAKAAN